MEWQRDGYVISTDPDRLDRAAIWRFLRTTYWAADISRAVLDRSVENALVFGLLSPQGDQAGFARVVTDRATEISSVPAGQNDDKASAGGAQPGQE